MYKAFQASNHCLRLPILPTPPSSYTAASNGLKKICLHFTPIYFNNVPSVIHRTILNSQPDSANAALPGSSQSSISKGAHTVKINLCFTGHTFSLHPFRSPTAAHMYGSRHYCSHTSFRFPGRLLSHMPSNSVQQARKPHTT